MCLDTRGRFATRSMGGHGKLSSKVAWRQNGFLHAILTRDNLSLRTVLFVSIQKQFYEEWHAQKVSIYITAERTISLPNTDAILVAASAMPSSPEDMLNKLNIMDFKYKYIYKTIMFLLYSYV